MSSDFGPLLIGLAAAGLVLVLIGIIRATWSLAARIGKRLQQRQSRSPQSWATSQELVDRLLAHMVGRPNVDKQGSSAAIEKAEEHRSQELVVDVERQSEGLRRESQAEAERIIEDARRQAVELLEESRFKLAPSRAGLEEERAAFERLTRLDSLATSQEAERKAEELLVAAELQYESLVREAEAEAERKAAEITEEARRQARKLLEEAELEAKGIVVAAGARRETELAHERAALEKSRTRLDSLAAIAKAAEHKAQELIVAAERDSEGLRRASEAEAERITDDARRQAKELLEKPSSRPRESSTPLTGSAPDS